VTWMARVGWRRAGGPLRVDEHPASPARPRPRPTWIRACLAARPPGLEAACARGDV